MPCDSSRFPVIAKYIRVPLPGLGHTPGTYTPNGDYGQTEDIQSIRTYRGHTDFPWHDIHQDRQKARTYIFLLKTYRKGHTIFLVDIQKRATRKDIQK